MLDDGVTLVRPHTICEYKFTVFYTTKYQPCLSWEAMSLPLKSWRSLKILLNPVIRCNGKEGTPTTSGSWCRSCVSVVRGDVSVRGMLECVCKCSAGCFAWAQHRRICECSARGCVWVHYVKIWVSVTQEDVYEWGAGDVCEIRQKNVCGCAGGCENTVQENALVQRKRIYVCRQDDVHPAQGSVYV